MIKIMWEDMLIKVIGQFLALTLLVCAWSVLRWIFKKLFKQREGVKTFKECHKYNINDEIEALTKDGINVKGVITHVGTQSYIVTFERNIGFKNKEPRISHSLYESEIEAINSKLLKAERIL